MISIIQILFCIETKTAKKKTTAKTSKEKSIITITS